MKHRIKFANTKPQLVYDSTHYYAYPAKHRIALAEYMQQLIAARLHHA